MLCCRSLRYVQCIRALSRCSWAQIGRNMSEIKEIAVEESEYQRAVTALNGLQTSADVLEVNREKRKRTDLSLVDQPRRDEHHHREPRAKLRHMLDYLECSGIFSLSDLDRLNAIHVTGTKGKGSVCAMCEIILRKHNLKTGFFSSPHLLEVRERIRLDGVPLSKSKFVTYFWECYNKLKEAKGLPEGLRMPAYFKFLTIMAFHVFLKEKVDVAVIEVGIGGTYDCTNIMERPTVCAISSLGYDHMEMLGETLEKIAWQKGGICKPGRPAYTSPQFLGPMKTLAERAAELKTSSFQVAPPLNEYPTSNSPLQLGLAGIHQQANASLAVQVCRTWLQDKGMWSQDCYSNRGSVGCVGKQLHGVSVARPFLLTQEFREGLEQCWWPGRNQLIKKGRVTYYLDGAHTPQSLKSCAEWFKTEAKKEASGISGPVVRVLLFNTTKKRNPKLLMQALLDCGFEYAAFSPNIAAPQGMNSADQTNLTVTVDSQCARAAVNHRAWLEVNHCLEAPEPIETVIMKQREGLVTSAPDPLSLCTGEEEGWRGVVSWDFKGGNAHIFACISDVVQWCTSPDQTSTKLAPDFTSAESAPPPESTPPTSSSLASAEHVQVLVTGSLHLVGATMSALGCKVEDL